MRNIDKLLAAFKDDYSYAYELATKAYNKDHGYYLTPYDQDPNIELYDAHSALIIYALLSLKEEGVKDMINKDYELIAIGTERDDAHNFSDHIFYEHASYLAYIVLCDCRR